MAPPSVSLFDLTRLPATGKLTVTYYRKAQPPTMKFRIEICGFSKDVDSMFDLLSAWRDLQITGCNADYIRTYELNSQYEWVSIDAQHIWDGMSRLLAVK